MSAPSNAFRGTLDIDGNNAYDGLVILRYMFGLTGPALTAGGIGPSPSRSSPADILQYLGSIRPALDVDGNTQVDALSDGLILLRYLFGLRGAALTAGAMTSGATRTTAQIEAYIQTLLQ